MILSPSCITPHLLSILNHKNIPTSEILPYKTFICTKCLRRYFLQFKDSYCPPARTYRLFDTMQKFSVINKLTWYKHNVGVQSKTMKKSKILKTRINFSFKNPHPNLRLILNANVWISPVWNNSLLEIDLRSLVCQTQRERRNHIFHVSILQAFSGSQGDIPLLAGHNVGASYSNSPRCLSVCLSHANISQTKRDRPTVTMKRE